MSYQMKLDGLIAKREVTYATDPTPSTSTDAVRLSDRLWNTIRVTPAFPNRRENTAPGTLLPIAPGTPRGWLVDMDFGVELRGAGSAYGASVLPDVADLLVCCGLTETITTTGGSEKVEYTPASSSHASTTIYAYAGGKRYIITGCRGTVRWAWTAGGLMGLRFTIRGLSTTPTEVSLPSLTFDSPVPPGAVGMSCTVGGVSLDVIAGEFDLGADLQTNASGNATDGIAGIEIAAFRPTVKLNAKAVAVSTADPHTDFRAPTARALLWTGGSVQYNKINLVNSASYYMGITNEDQNRFAGWQLGYDLVDVILRFN